MIKMILNSHIKTEVNTLANQLSLQITENTVASLINL